MDLSRVRNLSCIAHVDHGKTTLTDSLAHRAGLISDDDLGTKRFTDNRDDEKARGITIKSTGVTLLYNYQDINYRVNLIDSPGHVDFSSEVTAALRVTDGALVVVDAVEGVSVQTETVLRQALKEQVKPVLVINKLDRYMFELKLTPEEAFQKIQIIIQAINSLIETYQSEDCELNLIVSPKIGNVVFACGIHGWGFTLHDFAKLYLKEGQDIKKSMSSLWKKDNFPRLVLTPLFKLVDIIMTGGVTECTDMTKKLGITLSDEDHKKSPKDKYKLILRKWLPLSEALLYCIVNHLPSPIVAQRYRVNTLYDGPMDDKYADGIRNCNPNGPLMIYISKLFPMENGGRFYAFGRVFSGTVSGGMKVNIMGSNYVQGTKEDFFEGKSIQRVITMIGNRTESTDEISCGNTVALVGIDQYLVKSGTITDTEGTHPIKTMKFSVSPVVRVAVEAKNPADISKLAEAMKKLSKSDPCVQCSIEETGEHIIAGVGELHLEICLNDLRSYMKGEIKVSPPVVPFRESVSQMSRIVCLSKSPNRHNRLYLKAEPLHPQLVDDIINKVITFEMDPNKLARHLIDKYDWNPNDARKIWAFGPCGDEPTNILVDCTQGTQYMNEIKDSIISGFEWTTRKGVLCEEPLRGVRFNIIDVTLHSDQIHRNGGQLIPTARRCLYASELTAQPVLMEPMYLVDVQVPQNKVGIIYSCFAQKRGRVTSEQNLIGSLYIISGYLPVLESFGFNEFIREQTSGQGFPQMVFDHWEAMIGDPLDPNSKVHQIIKDVRKRKDLKEMIPALDNYLDKL